MILITGTDDRKIADLRRELLQVGMISEKTNLSTLISRLSKDGKTIAVLHILEKDRPALENVMLLAKHLYPQVLHGALLANECEEKDLCVRSFDLSMPLSVKPKKLCESIVHSAIIHTKINHAEQMVGALRYHLFEKSFSMGLKRFSFSDAYTALLLCLMEAYPNGVKTSELLRASFLPLGYRSRSNVSHAVLAINHRFSESGIAKNGKPIICYDCENGYFLRS